MVIIVNLLIVIGCWLTITAISMIAYLIGWVIYHIAKWLYQRWLWIRYFNIHY